eukprot:5462026-Ditylum_brightwellii.AAC.1
MRLYSKKVPAKDAARQFIQRVRRAVPEAERVTKQAEDVQKSRYLHQDWRTASEAMLTQIEQKLKVPHNLLFFKGAIYEIIFNSDRKFSNRQLAVLYDLPSIDDISSWRPINVLKFPIGEKEIDFDPSH